MKTRQLNYHNLGTAIPSLHDTMTNTLLRYSRADENTITLKNRINRYLPSDVIPKSVRDDVLYYTIKLLKNHNPYISKGRILMIAYLCWRKRTPLMNFSKFYSILGMRTVSPWSTIQYLSEIYSLVESTEPYDTIHKHMHDYLREFQRQYMRRAGYVIQGAGYSANPSSTSKDRSMLLSRARHRRKEHAQEHILKHITLCTVDF